MGLRVVDHLKLVFDVAQKNVSLTERVIFVRCEKRLITERAERFHCVSLADERDSAAVADFERLCDQFDFADAARSQFDISTALLADGHLLVDLPLDAANFSK